jgi:hypothetical protein
MGTGDSREIHAGVRSPGKSSWAFVQRPFSNARPPHNRSSGAARTAGALSGGEATRLPPSGRPIPAAGGRPHTSVDSQQPVANVGFRQASVVPKPEPATNSTTRQRARPRDQPRPARRSMALSFLQISSRRRCHSGSLCSASNGPSIGAGIIVDNRVISLRSVT